MAKPERQTWTWWFDQLPERLWPLLWPLLADTPRFNEAMGLPKYQVEEILDKVGAKTEKFIKRAALAIQSRPPEGLAIKLGLHSGPCVAVTLNGRLDYFGSTVNLAARLESLSRGGDIVLSDRLASDPAVLAVISSLHYLVESAELKGFGVPVSFRRLVPDMVNSYTALS
jgi:class 3 adenylate cyclase